MKAIKDCDMVTLTCADCGKLVGVIPTKRYKQMLTKPFCSDCFAKYDPHIPASGGKNEEY